MGRERRTQFTNGMYTELLKGHHDRHVPLAGFTRIKYIGQFTGEAEMSILLLIKHTDLNF